MKGLCYKKYTYMHYESSITSGLKVMAKVNVFQKEVKLQE